MPTAIAATAVAAKARLALLWLIVALVFQGVAVQTHAHPGAERDWAAAGSVRAVAAADGQKQSPAAPPCQLCEEKALFGAYLLAGSVAIAAPVTVTYHYASASLPLLALRASSHAWRSRAPPLSTT